LVAPNHFFFIKLNEKRGREKKGGEPQQKRKGKRGRETGSSAYHLFCTGKSDEKGKGGRKKGKKKTRGRGGREKTGNSLHHLFLPEEGGKKKGKKRLLRKKRKKGGQF